MKCEKFGLDSMLRRNEICESCCRLVSYISINGNRNYSIVIRKLTFSNLKVSRGSKYFDALIPVNSGEFFATLITLSIAL